MSAYCCTSCGRYAFPVEGVRCYWCATPLTDAERHERTRAHTVAAPVRVPEREALFDAERRRLHGPKARVRK